MNYSEPCLIVGGPHDGKRFEATNGAPTLRLPILEDAPISIANMPTEPTTEVMQVADYRQFHHVIGRRGFTVWVPIDWDDDKVGAEVFGRIASMWATHAMPERLSVMQGGEKIGSVPASFDPMTIRSTSVLYSVRQGDFQLEGNVWVACNTLGPGDLDAVPGFKWDRER